MNESQANLNSSSEDSDCKSVLTDKYYSKKKVSSQVIQALKDGDPDAYKVVFLRFYEPLAEFLSAMIHDIHEGEELAQETMAGIWVGRDKLDPDRNISGYIYKAGRNAALQYIRRQKVRDVYANDYMKWGDCDVSGDEVILAKEAELLITMKIAGMPEQKRLIFEMHRQREMTYEDIARELGISVNTVKYHMKSILRELKEVLTLFVALVSIF